jgi:hypothetical protein
MKKPETEKDDWLRPEYRRSDLGEVVRGKYASRLSEMTNIVVLDPQVARAFPNDDAVNKALRGLLELARSSARVPPPRRPQRGRPTKAEGRR